MSPRLTIVLPLKGRALFTLRFLWHANACRMPYRFLVADGLVHPALADLLSNSTKVFPNLDVEYVQYPEDTDFTRFFAKMHDAVRRVRTPYVMLADNDDFLVPSGIERSLDFLETAPDYVSCGGGIAGFSVYSPRDEINPGVVGQFNQFSFRYAAEDRSQDIGSLSTAQRLIAGAQYSWGYYAVYRSAVQVEICREASEMNFSDLMLYEWFCGLRALTLGKARSDPSTIGYLRQYWTTLRSSFSKDWVHHLLRSRFTTEFADVIGRLCRAVGQADGIGTAEFDGELRRTFEKWYHGFLRHNYGPLGMVRGLLRERAPAFLAWLKRRRRFTVGFERRALFRQLANHGAASAYLDEFRRELACIEDVLTGDSFATFLRQFVPTLGLSPK